MKNILRNIQFACYFLIVITLTINSDRVHAEKAAEKANDALWGKCQASIKKDDALSVKTATDKPYPDAIYLEADTGKLSIKQTSRLSGDVIIQQNGLIFNADTASYNRQTSQINAKGHVIFNTPRLELQSHAINYNLINKNGEVDQASYTVGEEGAHGKSNIIKIKNAQQLELDKATFTTCPVSVDSWHLASSKITLDNQSQIGHAKNVTLKVGTVPVFYFPWLKFPISNQRLSGFLTPSLRLQSNTGISIPYYFNLAPNYDATITSSYLSNHGFEFDTEFRYLTDKHKGEIVYDLIPKDQSYEDKARDYFKINHHTTVTKNTEINLLAEGVSDNDYFNDFSTSLEDSSRSSLKRRLEIKTKKDSWQASAAMEDFQVLDINDAPYARLPELRLSYKPKTPAKSLKLEADSEIVYFDKSAPNITGTRANLKLSASRKWGNDAWYFKPGLSLQHTLYSLNHSNKNEISRTLPTLTLDSGLFFDREFSSPKTGKPYVQTLEPRLFYTFTPFKDQTDIPIFDTSLQNFSATTALFSDNRFTGKDRIADNNQLTFAVTTRFQDRVNGKEIFKASIGQSLNFKDRKVTLPGGTIQTGKRSDLVLELSGRLNDNFRVSSTALWSHEKKRIPSYELRLNYQDENKRIANIHFLKLDTELKQVTLSGALPINNKWSMVASSTNDLDNNRNLESLVGIEYQDCCWKTRLVAKRYLNSDNETYETPIFLEFELKGLGNLGTGASREIKDKIYGYDDY